MVSDRLRYHWSLEVCCSERWGDDFLPRPAILAYLVAMGQLAKGSVKKKRVSVLVDAETEVGVLEP